MTFECVLPPKKSNRLRARMAKALKHQDELKANMVKFNTFVREKQLKADRGILVEAKEREMGEKIGLEIAEKDQLVQNLEKVKVSPNYIMPIGGCLMMPLRLCLKLVTHSYRDFWKLPWPRRRNSGNSCKAL